MQIIPDLFNLPNDLRDGLWADASTTRICLHKDEDNGFRVAVARGSELAVFNVTQEGVAKGSGSSSFTPMHACLAPGEITSMAWITFNSAVHLLTGTVSGHLLVHESSGQPVIQQRLHSMPIQSIRVQNINVSGLSSGHPNQEEVTIAFSDSIARISCVDLLSTLKQCSLAALENQRESNRSQGSGGFLSKLGSHKSSLGHSASQTSGHMARVDIRPVAFQRWELPRTLKGCVDAVCLGQAPRDLYSVLQGSYIDDERLVYCVGAESPTFSSLSVSRQPGRGTLAVLQGIATSIGSVTSGAVGLARAAGSRVFNTPSNITSGLRALVLLPFLEPTSVAQPSSSRTPRFEPAAPILVFDNPTTLQPRVVEAAAHQLSLKDDGRVAVRLIPAPRGLLMAAVDGLGRVLLLEGSNLGLIRMWKGYREAQCAWLEVPSDLVEARQQQIRASSHLQPPLPSSPCITMQHSKMHQVHSTMLLLAIYSPRRQLVELWLARQGIRVLALAQVGSHCQLLQAQQCIKPSWGNQAMSKAMPKEPKDDQKWDRDDWDFDEVEGAEDESVNDVEVDSAKAGIVKDETVEGVLGKGLAVCYLFDAARGAITDLKSCLNRAVGLYRQTQTNYS